MRTFLRSSLVAGVILGLSDMTFNWTGDCEGVWSLEWLKFA